MCGRFLNETFTNRKQKNSEFYSSLFRYQGSMTYVYYGSLALLLWKCGTQLMSEMKYKPLKEEEDLLLKQAKGMKKTGKFQNVFK